MKNSDKRKLKRSAYTAAQWTWGLPQTLAGSLLYLIHRKDTHFDYNGARATVWDRDAGVSLGKFIFVPKKARSMSGRHANDADASKRPEDFADSFLLDHEYGHTLQSLILGPFYLLFVGAPSLLWSRLPHFRRKRKRTGKSYYSAPFESSANRLAAKARQRHHH